jgi:hypothetical protein
MKRVIAIVAIVAALVAYQTARATVVINVTAADLTDQNSNLTPLGALGILVADLSATGTGIPNDLALGTSLVVGHNLTLTSPGDTFQIIGNWNSTASTETPGALIGGTGGITATATGGNLFLLWFPTLTQANLTAPGGIYYGEYGGSGTSGEWSGNNSDPWTMPADGATVYPTALTTDNGGVTPASELQGSLYIVPEPSSIMLVVVGLLGGLALIRRSR